MPRFAQLRAADGADYLKTMLGFNAIGNGGATGDSFFCGMFGPRLNTLMDGGQMLGACPNPMDAPTCYLSPVNFDQLTVIKGPPIGRL
jgi:iron complex outermembrane receptor protein